MDEHSQVITIKKTVTYIVDENGNEVEQEPQSAERRAEIEKPE